MGCVDRTASEGPLISLLQTVTWWKYWTDPVLGGSGQGWRMPGGFWSKCGTQPPFCSSAVGLPLLHSQLPYPSVPSWECLLPRHTLFPPLLPAGSPRRPPFSVQGSSSHPGLPLRTCGTLGDYADCPGPAPRDWGPRGVWWGPGIGFHDDIMEFNSCSVVSCTYIPELFPLTDI